MTTETDVAVEMITVTIDGFDVSVPKGTLVIRAAEKLGIQIPRFCDHPLLDPVGACRQCLVDIEINGRKFPKPQASCTIPVEPGMIVNTQLTSAVADKAQKGIMEFLLINHPLDCPVCDKGGECPLQNQAMSNGRPESRFDGYKRTFEKPINISAQVLLDRERCVLCARCTRFSDQIAGDPFITLNERGALQQVGIYEEKPFDSYFSGNTVQICPVGALTGATYRFRARPFDLVSTPSACEHCASGCDMRTDVRRGKTLRRLAGDDAQVNNEWNCDKGRWAFKYISQSDRITTPLVRDAQGVLREASWPEALAVAAAGLSVNRAAVLVGGRATAEDAYGYSKFARVALKTNDIDFRARPHSEEERSFLSSVVVGSSVTYSAIDKADHVVLLGFEAEEESPIVFLRLFKQVRKRGMKVTAVAPFATRANQKLKADVIKTTAGNEANEIINIAGLSNKSVILVGERLAESQGALSAARKIADSAGAHLAWIPRRAGERGALEGRARAFESAIDTPNLRSDLRILSMLADEMGTPINLPTVEAAAREMNSLGTWDGARVTFTPANAGSVSGETILSSWRLLLDAGSLQDGEANLAKTAHPSVAVISADRAGKLGVTIGDRVTISSNVGAITLPVEIADVDSKTVWIPRNSQSSRAIALLGAASGIEVSVVKA